MHKVNIFATYYLFLSWTLCCIILGLYNTYLLTKKCTKFIYFKTYNKFEALESGMCEVMKIRLKRRIVARSGRGNQLLDIKTAVERPILKLGLRNFWCSSCFFYNEEIRFSNPSQKKTHVRKTTVFGCYGGKKAVGKRQLIFKPFSMECI